VAAAIKLLVAGGLGVVGRAVVERFAGRADVEVVALSRRAPDLAIGDATWLSVDLADPAATHAALAAHRDVTHVVYAALSEQPDLVRGWRDADNATANTRMLRHTLDALRDAPLQHLTLLQGTKAYGVHTGRKMRVPAREQDAVHDDANFYFAQEHLLRERAAQNGFGWTVLRPQIVLGVAMGSAMNPVAALGVYAVLARELGQPLCFPGHPHLLAECTDARLIAAAAEWAWHEPRAWQQAFNIANGDVVVWSTFFERLAALFGLARAEDCPQRLAEQMPHHAALWQRLARREGLVHDDMARLLGLSWQYADATWSARRPLPVPPIVSTLKLRQAGFGACIDTHDCIIEHLQAMQCLRYLPT